MATTTGSRELDAMGDDGHGRIGHGEVDHDVGIRFADDAERHADFADAGNQAGILAQQRMVGRFERGDDLKARILRGQRGDPLAHSPGRSVNGEFHVGYSRLVVGRTLACSSERTDCGRPRSVPGYISTIQFDRPNDFFEIVFDLHGPIGERGPVDAAAAEHAVEFILIVRVIGDGGGRIFELMAGEDAHDALARAR